MKILGIPNKKTVYVSDIHGDIKSLKLVKGLPEYDNPEYQWVYGGDYIDGEPYGLEVIQFVMHEVDKGNYATLGNHDKMLLSFISDPDNWKQVYYGNGGKTTLNHMYPGGHSANGYARYIKNVYPDILTFISELPTSVESANQLFVHAGVNPDVPWRATSDEDAIWIRDDYYNAGNTTGKTVVSGHTPTYLINGHPSCPVEVLKGDPKRYLIDAGEHAMNRHLNVLVLDEKGEYLRKHIVGTDVR